LEGIPRRVTSVLSEKPHALFGGKVSSREGTTMSQLYCNKAAVPKASSEELLGLIIEAALPFQFGRVQR